MNAKSRKSKLAVENILAIMINKKTVDRNLTTEKILSEFRKPKDKVDRKILETILRKLVKNNPNAKKPFDEYINNFDKHQPYACLEKFLIGFYKEENAAKVKVPPSESSSTKRLSLKQPSPELCKEFKSNIPSPGLSSTKISSELVDYANVADIRKRIVQAATGGLSKSAQSSAVDSYCSTASIFNNADAKKNVWFLDDTDFTLIQSKKITSIIATPVSDQEKFLLKEILYCLIGVPGTFIKPEISQNCDNPLPSTTYKISADVNTSLRDMAYSILPLANYYSVVQRFILIVTSSKCGQILQSLAASLRSFTFDYYSSLVQLEADIFNQNLNLNRLHFCLRPSMKTMEHLAEIVSEITRSDIVGAKLLTFLCEKISLLTGDSIGQQILVNLVEDAAVPFFETLERWILKGVIIDPQQEFMIEDNEVMGRAEIDDVYSDLYWAKRYFISRDKLPSFLESMSEQILRTGKYLNVIRQCNNSNANTERNIEDKLRFSAINQRSHQLFIEKAYNFASNKLLQLLVSEKDMMGHLTSVKRYFLLQQGDFINQFMDATEEELAKNVQQIQPIKLENLLGLTLRTSAANQDQYKDHLNCELSTTELTKIMSRIHLAGSNQYNFDENIELVGYECFTFSFDVKWPMSLILPHSIITQYQLLFRLLFQCKHVERRLCCVWRDNKNILKFSPSSKDLFRSTFLLRQRMLHAIQNLAYYFMVEVIEPYWLEFLSKMQKVKNVDEVIEHHNDFVDKCMVNCLLKSPLALTTVINVFNVCIHFSALVQKEQTFKPSATYFENIEAIDAEFSALMGQLLNQINDESYRYPTHKYTNLGHRINFNTFFNEIC